MGLQSVASLTALQDLELLGCSKVTSVDLGALSSLTALRRLNVPDAYAIGTLWGALPGVEVTFDLGL